MQGTFAGVVIVLVVATTTRATAEDAATPKAPATDRAPATALELLTRHAPAQRQTVSEASA